ncbi:MAG TPA: hypothetical protein VF700_04610 [Segetibacter sp.]
MAKPSTFPTLYNECKTISVTFFKKHGYLNADQCKSGTMTWRQNGSKTGSMSFVVNTGVDCGYLELNYKCNGQTIKYPIPLITIPANIGKGLIWFFRCPKTSKLCQKLYLGNTYFLHRDAFTGAMYEKQTFSKNSRQQSKLWAKAFCADDVLELISRKHFKAYYAGKPTKRYLRLLKQIQAANTMSEDEILNVFRR